MIDPLNTWKSTLAALPKVLDVSWAPTFAAWYAARIVNITPDPTFLDVSASAPPFSFIFNVATFTTGLLAAVPTNSQAVGIAAFADAWEAAILTSVVIVGAGAFVPPSSPATLFSVVATSLLDPVSIVLGKAMIQTLALSLPTIDPLGTDFPEKFRDATLLLTITVSGTNSIVPVPTPLVVPFVPLV